jgi:hypothetical protein
MVSRTHGTDKLHFVHLVVSAITQYLPDPGLRFGRADDVGWCVAEFHDAGTCGVARLHTVGGALGAFHGVHGCGGGLGFAHFTFSIEVILNQPHEPREQLVADVPTSSIGLSLDNHRSARTPTNLHGSLMVMSDPKHTHM